MIELVTENDISDLVERNDQTLKKMQGKTVLITGAAGFLGRYFMKVFERFNANMLNKIQIVALDNHITSLRKEHESRVTDPNIEWIFGDAIIGSALPNKFDFIIHAAGIASPQHYRANPLETIYVAVDVTRALLEKARIDNARLIFFSSSEIYGDPTTDNVPTSENYRGNVSSMGPRACYDESKRLGETLCYVYKTEFNTHASCVRPFNVYGPGMLPGDYRVLPNFANSLVKGNKLKVYGGGTQTRTFCYITDAISGFLSVLVESVDASVFNVGNPKPEISMKELAELSCNIFGSPAGYELISYPDSYPSDEPNRRCPDISSISEKLGYKPIVDLNSGLIKFFSWVKKEYPKIDI